MPIQPDQRYYLKLKALYYLYEKEYTQTEIAKMLGISRVTLGKLLEEAKTEGMIKIEIIDVRGSMRILKMEEQLKQRFHLQDIKLVDCQNLDKEGALRRIASEAAGYFDQQIHSKMKIGLTWGRTLNSVIEQLPDNPAIRDLSVYTLLGGSSSSPDFQPTFLVQQLIRKYSGTAQMINAPFLCQSAELCGAFKNEPQIHAVLEACRDLDMTMVGIGEEPMAGAQVLSDYPFDAATIGELVQAGAVGDICGNFFDIDGNLCQTSLTDRIISIDLEELRHHKKVVGVGGGPAKIRSVLGALNGGYLDVLITDVKTAEEVLKLI